MEGCGSSQEMHTQRLGSMECARLSKPVLGLQGAWLSEGEAGQEGEK